MKIRLKSMTAKIGSDTPSVNGTLRIRYEQIDSSIDTSRS